MQNYSAVLFDLDGTLVDTAADMELALNILRQKESLPVRPSGFLRHCVSQGAVAMLKEAFPDMDESERLELRSEFLNLYHSHLAEKSRPYSGVMELLDYLDQHHISWGIVTNKPGWLTEPLLKHLKLWSRSQITISSDTFAENKPHPLPMENALKVIEKTAVDTVYVGDAPVDVAAAHAVNMDCIVAAWGYIPIDSDTRTWGAKRVIEKPLDLIQFLSS